jgi:hypothetical protein
VNACCGTEGYDADIDICCKGNLYSNEDEKKECCGKASYSEESQGCCGRVVYALQTDKCCDGKVVAIGEETC